MSDIKLQVDQHQPEFDIKFVTIPESIEDSFKQLFVPYEEGLMRSEPGGFVQVPHFCENAKKIFRIQPRKDDVWLLTFPKTGTTWTAELLWQVVHGCNYEEAAKERLYHRVPFPEGSYFGSLSSRIGKPAPTATADIEAMPSPRIIRPHLPFYLLPPNLLETSKVVYVARNPKDVIVSYYFHHKLFVKAHGYTGDLETFAKLFMEDKVMYAPFFPQVIDAWNLRHHPNMHFVFFEDMKKNLRGELEKIVNFLEKPLTVEQLDKLTEHLRFDNFKKNEGVNNEAGKKMGIMNLEGNFCRKGKTGDWMNHFSPELNNQIDNWIEKNLAGTDLKFVTNLELQD